MERDESCKRQLKSGINDYLDDRVKRIRRSGLATSGNGNWPAIMSALKEWESRGLLKILTNPEKARDDAICIEMLQYIDRESQFEGWPSMDEFIPENDLESALLKAQQGDLPLSDLLAYLINQPIFVLNATNKLHKDLEKRPMAVWFQSDEDLVAAFSSMNRAISSQQKNSGFKHIIELPCGELLEIIAEGLGLVINPFMKVGLQLSAAYTLEMKNFMGRNSTADGKSEFVLDKAFIPEVHREKIWLER